MKISHRFEVNVNDLKLFISANVKESNANWLLCLHGIQSSKKLFDGLFEQPFASNFSVLALDLVGFGQSSKPEKFSYDINDQAIVVMEVLKLISVRRLHIVRHSLGGMIGTILLGPLKDKTDSFINLEGNLTLSDCGLSKEVVQYPFPIFQSESFTEIKKSIRQSCMPSGSDRADRLDEVPDFAFYKTCQSIVKWASTDKILQLFSDAHSRRLFVSGSHAAICMIACQKEMEGVNGKRWSLHVARQSICLLPSCVQFSSAPK